MQPIINLPSGRLIPQGGVVFQDSAEGTDTYTRQFICRTSEARALLPANGDNDPVDPSFKITSRRIIEERGMLSTIEITSQGKLDKSGRSKIKVSGRKTEASVQVTLTTSRGAFNRGPVFLVPGQMAADTTTGATYPRLIVKDDLSEVDDNEEQASVTLSYISPETTFRYSVDVMPKGPAYDGLLLEAVAEMRIIDVTPARFTGRPMFQWVVQNNGFEVEYDGGYWNIVETNKAMIISRRAFFIQRWGITPPYPFTINEKDLK